MEEADKDWMMIRIVDGLVFLLVPAHPGSPEQRAIKRLFVVVVVVVVVVLVLVVVLALAS